MTFIINYTNTWYDGINDVHECGLKAEYFYMYLETLSESEDESHF